MVVDVTVPLYRPVRSHGSVGWKSIPLTCSEGENSFRWESGQPLDCTRVDTYRHVKEHCWLCFVSWTRIGCCHLHVGGQKCAQFDFTLVRTPSSI